MQKIRKAVFPVAGFGTRFLPVTKAMPKELMPIINKPLIQYAVEEAILAGIDTLIFITGRNKRAIEDHFDSNQELELALEQKGKFEQAEMVQHILPKEVECIFVRQPKQLGLGHAILCAERAVGNEPFAVLLADDFLTDEVGNGALSDLVKGISKYGVIDPGLTPGSVNGLIEKPEFKDATSNLASIGRYILSPDIFDILRTQNAGSGGEIQLADAINVQAQHGGAEAIMLKGQRFDCGDVHEYLHAILHIANRDGLLEK